MAAFHNFLSEADYDGDGEISLQDIELLLAERRQKIAARQPRGPKRQALRNCANRLHTLVNSTSVQTLMYLMVVTCFQLLIESLRAPEEFFLDEMVTPTLPTPLAALAPYALSAERSNRGPAQCVRGTGEDDPARQHVR